jgi:anti-sigma-K factor RskA
MSAGDPERTHDCGGEAAAYVLGALPAEEIDSFRRHMSGCAVCRDEVAALEPVVDILPMAAPQYELPRGLRRKVLGAAREEQHEAAAARHRRRSVAGWVRLPLPGLAAALVAVIGLAVVAGVELGSSTGSGGTRVIAATTSAGTAEVKISGGHAELVVRDLPPPPAGHIYEVWLKRDGQPPSPTSTLFSVTSNGGGAIGLPGTLHGVRQVLVTPEPSGGSLAPTHAPVIEAQLT